ncbi:alpha/beta fold hydrolase [Enterococcus sp. DIV0756]|uniref:alpha/beta fold hydrolase n=1 Tax=Enterococcus sp. DIV0756 TaxID=2774636 RepID=UPI003F29268D
MIVTLIVFCIIVTLLLVRGLIRKKLRTKYKINGLEGIDSIEKIPINGINQIIHVRGEKKDNPVLLYLHGGPGFTDMPVSYLYQKEWEKHFTIVQWDQRLSGKTYMSNKSDQSFKQIEDSINLRIKDVIELTEYLLDRFEKEKIVLMGHSWGTVLGTYTIKAKPDIFSVFISVSQLVNLLDSEKLGYHKTLFLAEEKKSSRDTSMLKSIDPYPVLEEDTHLFTKKMMILRKLQSKYKIGMPASYSENFSSFVFSPYYSLYDLSYYFKNVFSENYSIYRWLHREYDLRKIDLQFEIPTIFIYGENDWTTPSSFFKNEIYEKIKSPLKEFHIVKNAAHRPMNDNKKDFLKILVDVKKKLCLL